MKIIDLTDYYLDFLVDKNSPDLYFATYPSLFDHYFQYWSNKKAAFHRMTRKEVYRKKLMIKKSIEQAEIYFANYNLDTSDIKIVLFVGQNTTNGHAFIDSHSATTFIPIESYHSPDYADVFCIHEVAHAMHYLLSPAFYFKDKKEKEIISRNLICEGIASLFSKEILQINDGVALWADYLSKDQLKNWIDKCMQECNALKGHCKNNFYTSDPHLFYVWDFQNPFKSRGGYWLGIKLIEKIKTQENLSLNTILTIPRNVFEHKILKELESEDLCQYIKCVLH